MRPVILLVPVLSAGCDAFYTQATDTTLGGWGNTIRTYDDRLPTAMEDVFWSCAEPLVILDGDTSVDLVGTCESWQFDAGSPENALVLLLQAADNSVQPIQLGGPGDAIQQSFGVTSGWFRYTCDATITPIVALESVALYDLQAWWTTHDGAPAMRVDFDFDDGITADVSFDYTVTCPGAPWVTPVADALLAPVLGGTHALDITGGDLDLWLALREVDGQFRADIDVRFAFTDIVTGTTFDTLPQSVRDAILDSASFDADDQAFAISEQLEDSLTGISDSVENQLSGEEACSAALVGGALELVTDEDCVSDVLYVGPSMPWTPR